jgi:threonylcarbamoyladenosine tRNA methylthiotransferase MtaB
MGRKYDRDRVLRSVEAARCARDDPFIGADIILGFPGETDEDFRSTVDLLERVQPAWVHAFTFSPRPGTRAFDMKPRVPERVAVERAAAIHALAERGKAAFALRRTGMVLEAVSEAHGVLMNDIAHPVLMASSAEYLKLEVRGVPDGFLGAFTCTAIKAFESGTGGDTPDLYADFLSAL